MYCVRIDDLPKEPLYEGLSTIAKGIRPETMGSKDMSVNYVTMKPGNGTPIHVHYQSEEGWFILKGQGHLLVGEQRYPFQARHLLFCPAGVRHQMVNSGEEVLEYLAITAPPVDFATDNIVLEPYHRQKHR